MGQTAPHITDAEWSVLEVLWKEGAAPVRRLADALYPKGAVSEYATVHKLLERLKAKGYVRRERRLSVNMFRPVHRREEVVGRQLETLVDKLCAGSIPALLSNLIRAKRLTPGELRELQALVAGLESPAPSKDRG